MRASGSKAKVCMEVWLQTFKERLEKAGIKVWLMRKYVDDVIVVCSMARRGDRVLGDGTIGRTCESLGEDRRSKVSRPQVTLNLLEAIANKVLPFLKFTGEAAEGDQGIPVLDTRMWFGPSASEGELFQTPEGLAAPGTREEPRNEVRYQFFKKPMASPISILQRSAMMEGCKVATASAEFRRRWKNSSESTSREVFEKITRDYVNDLLGMGYHRDWVEKVLLGATKGYCRVLFNCKQNQTERNRSSASSQLSRRYKKIKGAANWFQKMKPEEDEGLIRLENQP